MSLKKCKDCGNELSKKAKSCPSCGLPQPKQYGLGSIILVLFLGLLIFTSLDDSTSEGRPVSNYNTTPQLEVLSYNCTKEHGYIFVQGEVKNISSNKLENVMAVGEFRNIRGELIKSEDALLEYNPIMPSQTSPFKAGGTHNPEISGCNLSFKHLFGSIVHHKSKGE